MVFFQILLMMGQVMLFFLKYPPGTEEEDMSKAGLTKFLLIQF